MKSIKLLILLIVVSFSFISCSVEEEVEMHTNVSGKTNTDSEVDCTGYVCNAIPHLMTQCCPD